MLGGGREGGVLEGKTVDWIGAFVTQIIYLVYIWMRYWCLVILYCAEQKKKSKHCKLFTEKRS